MGLSQRPNPTRVLAISRRGSDSLARHAGFTKRFVTCQISGATKPRLCISAGAPLLHTVGEKDFGKIRLADPFLLWHVGIRRYLLQITTAQRSRMVLSASRCRVLKLS